MDERKGQRGWGGGYLDPDGKVHLVGDQASGAAQRPARRRARRSAYDPKPRAARDPLPAWLLIGGGLLLIVTALLAAALHP